VQEEQQELETNDQDELAEQKNLAAEEIATKLTRTPPFVYRGGGVEIEWSDPERDKLKDPTPEQIASVKDSSAYRMVCSLIDTAFAQQEARGVARATRIAVQFFESSGTIYRLRVRKLENEHRSANRKGRVSLDHVPAVWPDRIYLWEPPQFNSAGEGSTSMEGVDRDELRGAATEFFQVGIRCSWFEKMLLEALVCAELYATTKHLKTTALVNPNSITMAALYNWAYEKTRGRDPGYTFLVVGGRWVLGAIKVVMYAALLWYVSTRYQAHPTWGKLAAVALLAIIGVSWVGRSIVQTLVGWAKPQSRGIAEQLRASGDIGRGLVALSELHRVITSPVMSTTLAQRMAMGCYEKGGIIDQIVIPYLDRAVAQKEFLWMNGWW